MTQTIAAPRDVIAGEIAEIKGRNRTFTSDHDDANSIFLALAQAGYLIVRDEPVAWRAGRNFHGMRLNPEFTEDKTIAELLRGHPRTDEFTPLFAPLKETTNGE